MYRGNIEYPFTTPLTQSWFRRHWCNSLVSRTPLLRFRRTQAHISVTFLYRRFIDTRLWVVNYQLIKKCFCFSCSESSSAHWTISTIIYLTGPCWNRKLLLPPLHPLWRLLEQPSTPPSTHPTTTKLVCKKRGVENHLGIRGAKWFQSINYDTFVSYVFNLVLFLWIIRWLFFATFFTFYNFGQILTEKTDLLLTHIAYKAFVASFSATFESHSLFFFDS